jgi:hypothetical protein
MNRNSGSNWSSQGDSNYDSRNRYSGNYINLSNLLSVHKIKIF